MLGRRAMTRNRLWLPALLFIGLSASAPTCAPHPSGFTLELRFDKATVSPGEVTFPVLRFQNVGAYPATVPTSVGTVARIDAELYRVGTWVPLRVVNRVSPRGCRLSRPAALVVLPGTAREFTLADVIVGTHGDVDGVIPAIGPAGSPLSHGVLTLTFANPPSCEATVVASKATGTYRFRVHYLTDSSGFALVSNYAVVEVH